jgi:hypothetical protein
VPSLVFVITGSAAGGGTGAAGWLLRDRDNLDIIRRHLPEAVIDLASHGR